MTTTQSGTALGDATFGELAQALRGDLIRPGDEGYDDARSIWNGAHDRKPALIVRCRGAADVLRAVMFARSEGLPIAVRGGGHSIPGFSTVDDGLVLDLSLMNAVHVDPGRRTVPVACGVTWTPKRRRSGWPSPAAWCPRPASPASPWAAGSAGWSAGAG